LELASDHINGEINMSVKQTDAVATNIVPTGDGVSMQMLISSEEGPHFAMRRFVIKPGGSMPNHTNQVEHEQYVLNGSAEVGIAGEVFKVQQGDIVFIPALTPHWYKNTGATPFEFLCLVPNKPDFTTLIEPDITC
jgi:quercetin dioxygenase-like cupin family protein